ncbi:PREDICTED: transmembrane protein 8B [Apaloderma vittatum]|uniref:transmembrane protein 8B n=1 Tax=Apaloderma vittatum TaxID=57397 RepID=UPI000521A52A|nr:PREDICTED: transmembrane protein 8B [Apaloderma vittatum]
MAGAVRYIPSLHVKCRQQVLIEEEAELKEVDCTCIEPEQTGLTALKALEDECSQYGLFVTDYFTRTPRKLSPFRSFASIELFHFHIPEDTVIAVWNLITFKEQGGTFGDQCPDRSITVYFRSGAPSVINPLHTHFPRDTAVPGSFALTLTWTLPNRTTGVFNVTSPLPGDWFLAAHLPKDEGKISVKGLYEECQYLFQPQLIVQRLVNIAVLYRPPPPPPLPLQHWYYVLVERHPGVPGTVSFQVTVQLTGNELDPFSVHFYIFFGPNVSVPPDRPAVFVINLLPVLDSGGVLNLELRLNVSSLCGENVTVFGCLNHEVPLTSADNASVTCETETLAGFLLSVNTTASLSRLRIPYPQTGSWYLSLRSLCATEHGFEPCINVTAEVYLRAYLSPCINDCGIYGQCKLLRTNNYLYAACECKAGWNGWGCTDNAEAFSYGFQLLSTLLLCLSNVMFVPPVAIAVRSHYLLEAAVYIFTMFFSTFYHACDQPGIVVFCIMEYDVLQFCDFLGSLMSVWVTVIAMARLQPVVKQVLYLLGAMLLSMALQMDRHGLWNLLGPSLFALGIMAIAWTARTIRRRHCYPPTWKRWAFYLCPGALIAAAAVLLYAFVETEENYFYIHSIWHLLIAGSVGFLLPPRAKTSGRLGPLPRRKGCGYQLCVNEQEELGLVDPAVASINSICTS